MLTAAVVSRDVLSGASLRASLLQTNLVSDVRDWSLADENHPAPGERIPDVVLLDMDQESDPFLAFAAYLRRLRPSIRVIACSNVQQPPPQLLLQAMRSGIQDFLPKPVQVQALKDCLLQFIRENETSNSRPNEKVIVAIGAKGGAGTTTVAVNLGVQLVQVTKRRICLLDFVRPMGHASLLLDLKPRFSVVDAAENADRLDAHFFGGVLTRHRCGLEVLAGTSHPDEWQKISISALARIVTVAQSSSDFVVVDAGVNYGSEWTPILRMARAILLVAQPDLPSLWTLDRHLNSMAGLGVDADRVSIIINRWRQADDAALKKVEQQTRRAIYMRLPNDFRQVSEATNIGVPISANQKNALNLKFRELAYHLTGLSPENNNPKSGKLSNLFSFRTGR